jgi:hypothetical protein
MRLPRRSCSAAEQLNDCYVEATLSYERTAVGRNARQELAALAIDRSQTPSYPLCRVVAFGGSLH